MNNYAKQKYKAFVATKWSMGIIYANTLDELNKRIDKIKAKYPYVMKTTIYTRDDEAETPAFAQWRLVETKEAK